VFTRDRIGLVVNAKDAWPSTEEIAALGMGWVRSIVYDDSFDQFDEALQSLPAGVNVIALLNGENQFEGQPQYEWLERVQAFAERFGGRVLALECLNEWDIIDLWHDIPSDQWTEQQRAAREAQRVTRAVDRMHEAKQLLHDAGIACLLGSVCGPSWPAMLQAAIAECGDNLPDGVCLHPYAKTALGFPPGPPGEPFGFGELDEAVAQAHAITGLPVWVTEFGLNLDTAGYNMGDGFTSAEEAQAHYVDQSFEALGALGPNQLQVACLFCWIDRIGTADDGPFGLRHEPDSDQRAVWHTVSDWCHQGD